MGADDHLTTGKTKEDSDEAQSNQVEKIVASHPGEDVKSLLKIISSESRISLEKATKEFNRVLDDGKVRLVNQNPPTGLVRYFFSIYSFWYWLVVLFTASVYALNFYLPKMYPYEYLKYLVGAVFVLFIPGYALNEALFPNSEDGSWFSKLLTSVALSIIIVVMGGLFSILRQGTILLDPIISVLALPAVIFGVIGVWRKYGYFALSMLALKIGQGRK